MTYRFYISKVFIPYTHSDKIVCSLRSKLSLMRISPGSFSVPTDVTLKLPEGNIDAHKMILAAVSPVFERMFYGDFKEGNSSEVSLPSDNWNTMKLLIDFVYNGECEVNSHDDIVPLLEVIDRYQINKVPFQHMIGEAVLAKLDSSNYLTLLPKFASVMSEEANRKAAEKVMAYTKYDIIADESTREIPEEVLLPILQIFNLTCHDSQLFDFLVNWHDYQTRILEKSLHLTSEIFKCIRYSLIIPQILSSKVANCDLVDKQLLSQAYHYIYTSYYSLGEYNNDDPCKPPTVHLTRKPELGLKIEWIANDGITITYNQPNQCTISGTYNVPTAYIVKSRPLENGIFSFSVSNCHSFSFAISDSSKPDEHMYVNVLGHSNLISLYVYEQYLFVKYISYKTVKSTYGIYAGASSYCVTIIRRSAYSSNSHFCFNISSGIKK